MDGIDDAEVGMRVDELTNTAAEILEAGSERFATMAGDQDPAGFRGGEVRRNERGRDPEASADGGSFQSADLRAGSEEGVDDGIAGDVTGRGRDGSSPRGKANGDRRCASQLRRGRRGCPHRRKPSRRRARW
jgi:hypothetical protein